MIVKRHFTFMSFLLNWVWNYIDLKIIKYKFSHVKWRLQLPNWNFSNAIGEKELVLYIDLMTMTSDRYWSNYISSLREPYTLTYQAVGWSGSEVRMHVLLVEWGYVINTAVLQHVVAYFSFSLTRAKQITGHSKMFRSRSPLSPPM